MSGLDRFMWSPGQCIKNVLRAMKAKCCGSFEMVAVHVWGDVMKSFVSTRKPSGQRTEETKHRCVCGNVQSFFRNDHGHAWLQHGATTGWQLRTGAEKTQIMFGNITLFSKVTVLVNRSTVVFATRSRKYILSLIILSCYVMPVQRVLESSRALIYL